MANVTLKGKPINISGNLPKVGSNGPSFELIDSELKVRSLSEFKGKKKVISTVPSLDTPTCSKSAIKFEKEALKLTNTVILVVSADLPFAQKRFCSSENVTHVIPLSLMRSKKMAEDYGILIVDGPLAGLCARAIIILDESDRVIYTELVSEITEEPNYDKAIAALKA